MQHASDEAYEAEAQMFDELAEHLEAQGATYRARQYREMAQHNRERAHEVRNS